MIREKIRKEFEKEIEKFIFDLRAYQPLKVILYGSFARGDYHEGSDIDLVILKETSRRFVDRIGDVLKFYKGGLAIEPLVYTPAEFEKMKLDENPFIRQVLLEGKTVFEQK